MATSKVGIREFRDNLSSYLLESESPVAITRHGDTVGYYIPARRKRSDSEPGSVRRVAAGADGRCRKKKFFGSLRTPLRGAPSARVLRMTRLSKLEIHGPQGEVGD